MDESVSECCCAGPTCKTEDAHACPVSGTRGAPVDVLTVKALLTERALARAGPSAHWFCPEPSCDVVYFDADGGCYITTDIRVPVWQKERFGQRMVCYCFGECEDQIRAEITTTGFSRAVDRVREHIAHGRCACEVRNPRGACCLGDVAAAIKRVATALSTETVSLTGS